MSDNHDPRIVVIFESIILSAVFILSGFTQDKWQLYLTCGLITGIGGVTGWNFGAMFTLFPATRAGLAELDRCISEEDAL